MTTPVFEVEMQQGADFNATVNWYGGGVFRGPIEEIDPGYPTKVRVSAHGLPSSSDTPVIISGVQGAEILNSVDRGIELCTRVDADYFTVPISTVPCEWVVGTGEITFHQPSNLAGFTARCALRSKPYSGSIIHTFTTENSGIVLDANDGSILLTTTAAVTAGLLFGRAYGDVELISGAGLVTRVFRIEVPFSRETTK